MIKHIKSFAAVAVVIALAGCDQQAGKSDAANEVQLETQAQRISYLAATDFASSFKAQGVELDANAVAQAVRDVIAGHEVRLSEEEIKTTVETFQQEAMANQQAAQADAEAAMEKAAAENQAAGEAFLTENATKEGVVALESGLQYKVITEGEGPKPAATDVVEVHYRGTLLDGTEFDSSYKRGVPAQFRLDQVIPGWTEGVQLMSEGAKYEFYIPSDLAYGPGGAGGMIGPNATLKFEVELLRAKVSEEQGSEEQADASSSDAG